MPHPSPNHAPLDAIVIGPDAPSGVVLWMHGLGASGDDFVPVLPILDRPDLRFILPHAPVRPVTVNGGLPCPSWYDIRHLQPGPDRESAADIRSSASALNQLLQAQRDAGIASDRMAVVGFSQGGAMALHLALRWPERLAGVVALSTYLVLEHRLSEERSPASDGLPAFFGHGTMDGVVSPERGRHAANLLSPHLDVCWHDYPMDHSVCIDEVLDLRDFLNRVLPPPTSSAEG